MSLKIEARCLKHICFKKADLRKTLQTLPSIGGNPVNTGVPRRSNHPQTLLNPPLVRD